MRQSMKVYVKKIISIAVCLLLTALTMSGCSENDRPTMSISFDGDGNTVYNGNEQLF